MDWQCSGCNRHYPFTVTECPHCQPVATVTTGGTQPTSDNTASAQCKCAVKRTEVPGMGIIYSQRECPLHGYLHSAHC